jgi:plasmid stability protein
MPSLTIRNLSAETHRALKIRAARHGRSTEAEVRDILDQAARPEDRVRLGSLLAEIGREARLSPEEQAVFDATIARDRTPAQPLDFD